MAKQQETQEIGEETLVQLDLSELDTSFQNIRTGDFTVGESRDDGSGQSFSELVESIKTRGQKVPIVVRKLGKKFQIIAGFRRVMAIRTINQDSPGEKLKVKAIVKQLDDLGAVVENAIENQRQGLRGADLMMGLWRIYTMSLERGTELSIRALAGIVGCNHQHCADLFNVMKKAPEVGVLWHKAERAPGDPIGYQLGIREMRSISKLDDKKAQMDRYLELLADRAPEPEGDGDGDDDGPEKWIVAAISKAEKAADMLGHLERRGAIKLTKSMIWAEELETLGCKIKKGAKKRALNKIAKAAEKAHGKALAWVEPEEPAESDEEAAE